MFSISRLSIEQGYFGKLMSILTRSFWSKCSWSMIKSLPTLGLKCETIVIVIRKTKVAIDTTDIQAPDTVP